MHYSAVQRIGHGAAILSLVFAAGYIIPQILSELDIIPHPHNLFWLFLPSLFLAPAFLVTMICLHYSATGEYKIYTAIGAAFAILYCADVSLVYFTQLTVVIPDHLKENVNEKQLLLFDRKTFLMAIDCLGYFFMSLSTFFAAFAFREQKWLYRGLLWNGALMPVLVLAFFHPAWYYVGALWMFTFPLAMISAARFFYHVPEHKLEINFSYEAW